MALIKCPECGKEISSNASACPNCGNPVQKKTVPVRFSRPKQFNTSQFHASVFIDGSLVGSADNGGFFELNLPAGNHTVSLRNEHNGFTGGNATETKQFEIRDNTRSVDIEFRFKNTLTVGRIYISNIVIH